MPSMAASSKSISSIAISKGRQETVGLFHCYLL